ncbi:hypothetical protein J41TS12_03880 [Paenibacillus antibioticophila]|uniref:Helix-turn-helix domain-containing protein n=1 Tax=Paenibacillus antibioticophila TaxID=1274374 RepID=A0A919XRT2_9BACL|nr:helix-turn-helix domain-containing protein [Paenibacillus antibioticophila]GIO35527.1 hypothetical protein J41TS12_03880 [Paenibacillus antibioticophila]
MEETKLSQSVRLKKEHAIWRESLFAKKEGFFPLFSGFKEYLPKLSNGAVTLFIYIGLHSNNETGECFHSVDRIASFLKKTPRTINSYFKELEEAGLIERLQLRLNGVSHTFIRPYTEQKGD